ncbi:lipoyl(octanoyl) transferase LipB [Geosporobacter ferrireducens]|uniref:Octanoyltransferase n=1 Tax=Geosporobacter ferrireducens TaxID=1424294 RepID=A0A1D8GPN4_9FIRM|nr:lipoyl(octanoyl) transferase LipB [Geosporobacter ferrireducens]AOT72911.1 lipoyl(octanoyl) transferase [Geosporobacter ferrireducens]MTI55317.1 lipoyl(octanoyl) transferase LipB [Geosporobacter ferrireducens]
MTITRQIKWLDLSIINYEKSYNIQEHLHQMRKNREISDVIIFQECHPVITIGKSGSEKHLLASKEELFTKGIDVLYSNRGGDITYHGPGQLIISPILYLKEYTKSVLHYLRLLEQVVINLLERYYIIADRIQGLSGVWVENKKIASVGIAIKNGVTMHGVAVNVNPDLSHFDFIIPCGLKDAAVTSLKDISNTIPSLHQVRDDFLREFSLIFDVFIDRKEIEKEVYKNELWAQDT